MSSSFTSKTQTRINLWVLDILGKDSYFANLKKCRFHKNNVYFLSHIVLTQDFSKIDGPFTLILKIANNPSGNLLTLVDVAEDDEVDDSGRAIKISAKSQNSINLSKLRWLYPGL